jgi:hypothetical protein
MKILSLILITVPSILFSQEWSLMSGINSTPVNPKLNIGYNINFQYMRKLSEIWNVSLGLSNDVFKYERIIDSYNFPDPFIKSHYSVQNVATIPVGFHLNMALKKYEGLDLFMTMYINNGIRVHSKNVRIYESFEQIQSNFLLDQNLLYQGGFSYGIEGRYYLKNKKVIGVGMFYRLNRLKVNQFQNWNTTNNFQITLRFGFTSIPPINPN